MLKSVGLIARYDNKQALKLVEDLSEYLKRKNLTVYVEDTLAGKIKADAELVPLKNMKPDFLVTIGGDGTILRTCINIPKPEPPILAVNMGVRGFLTEIEPEEACEAMDRCLNGDFTIEKCSKLDISTAEGKIPDGLNDVVVSAGEPSKLLYTQIFKDEEPILKCQADGLIVATQTGSTGYSLSAGGPVLDLDVDAFVLTPICSLTVFRSIVFPADSKVTVKAIRPKEMTVLVDGRFRQQVTSEDACLTVTRSENTTSFIRFKSDFYGRLHNRLLFKGMGWNIQEKKPQRILVLDTSAFLAGFDPFRVNEEQVTVSNVEDEIRTNSMIWMRFKTAIENGKVVVKGTSEEALAKVKECAVEVGDLFYLSETDKQVIALALELKSSDCEPQIVSDDYSIQNVSKRLEIEFMPLATFGIRRVLEWMRYCPACHREYAPNSTVVECIVCGTQLKRKPRRRRKT